MKEVFDPAHTEARRQLSIRLFNQRDWEGALLAVDEALAWCPEMADMCASRIALLGKLHRHDEAARYLEALPAAVRDSTALVHARVNLLNLAGRHAEAQHLLVSGVRETIRLREFDLALINQLLTARISSGSDWPGIAAELAHYGTYKPDDSRYQGLIASYAMIYAWLNDATPAMMAIAERHEQFELLPDIDADRAMRVFYRYLRLLASVALAAPPPWPGATGVLNVLGESHCLSPANAIFPWHGELRKARSRFVMGIQMHHLAQAGENIYKQRVLSHLQAITKGPLLLAIGEIDCRPIEGMWRAAMRSGVALDSLVASTVGGYFAFLDQALGQRAWPSITLQGVPAPGYDLTDSRDPGDTQGFIEMIRKVNALLQAGARQRSWHFLDVHAATSSTDGLGNGEWHLDRYHLSPVFYQHAMRWIDTSTT